MVFEIIKGTNDWLKNYIGHTYSEKLQEKLSGGLFEEHSKYKQNTPFKNFIEGCNFLTNNQKNLMIKRVDSNIESIFEAVGKKCVAYSIEPETGEILDISGSSLLRDLKTGKIEDNIITDNFGVWYNSIFADTNGVSLIKDATGATTSYNFGGATTWNSNLFLPRCEGQFGSGSNAPQKSDYAVQTALGASPESGFLLSTGNGYNLSNQIVYNIDASPCGGTGTATEITSGIVMHNTASIRKDVMFTRDSITINYQAGKLMRAAYAWQI